MLKRRGMRGESNGEIGGKGESEGKGEREGEGESEEDEREGGGVMKEKE